MGVRLVAIRIGDVVRIGATPEVDPDVWDAKGLVMRTGPEDRVLVELFDGVDIEVRTEHINEVDHSLPPGPERTPFDV